MERTKIKGTVTRIIYSNDLYTVVAVKPDEEIPKHMQNGNEDTFIATGSLSRLVKNQQVCLTGKWVHTARYGWSFAVEEYQEIEPTTEEALVAYLSSKIFKGIGAKTAWEIVKTFGEKTLDVIRNDPDRLTEVKGITEDKKNELVKAYRENAHLEKLMLFLKPYGITERKIMKIYDRYKDRALEILQNDPYQLADDIYGIGFKTADQIARACRIDANHPFRVRSAVLYALKEAAASEGHVFLTEEELTARTKELLGLKKMTAEEFGTILLPVLEDMIEKQKVIYRENAFYLPFYYHIEKSAGERIRQLLDYPKSLPDMDIDEVIAEQQKLLNIKYSPLQKQALKEAVKNNIAIITGCPGTGKTTVIKGLIGIYRRYFPDKKVVLAAPTGRAAKRMEEVVGMEAKTLHRLLEFKVANGKAYCTRNELNPLEGDIFIVDEASMIDLELLELFLRAVPAGSKLVFVGDASQLPSVGAGNVLHDMIESRKIPVVCLTEIFRQKDTSRIIVNANLINRGIRRLEYGDDFEFIEAEDNLPELIKQKFMEELEKVKDINKIQVLTPFKTRTDTGADSLNRMFQEILNPPSPNKKEIKCKGRVFREKDKVIQYKNDYAKEVFNGDIGCIDRIGRDTEGVFAEVVFGNGRKVVYREDDFDNLDIAYATTVHKSQGSEYDTVIIPITTQHYILLQRNLIYTAITRAKRKVILIGSWKALFIAISNNKTAKRNSRLAERI